LPRRNTRVFVTSSEVTGRWIKLPCGFGSGVHAESRRDGQPPGSMREGWATPPGPGKPAEDAVIRARARERESWRPVSCLKRRGSGLGGAPANAPIGHRALKVSTRAQGQKGPLGRTERPAQIQHSAPQQLWPMARDEGLGANPQGRNEGSRGLGKVRSSIRQSVLWFRSRRPGRRPVSPS